MTSLYKKQLVNFFTLGQREKVNLLAYEMAWNSPVMRGALY